MYLFEKFDKDLIKSIINDIDITKTLILLYTKNHSTPLDKVEKWYKTKYTFERITNELIEETNHSSYEGMYQPKKNNLFPKDFTIHPKSQESGVKRLS